MKFLIGPEIFWLILYMIASLIGKTNHPPSKSLDNFIEYTYFYVPAVSLLLFALWWFPSVDKNWLLVRIWVSGIIGCHFVLERLMKEYSEQGPGIGMAYIAGLILQFIFLLAGSIFIKIKF